MNYDYLNIVTDYLCYIDYVALQFVCKNYYLAINKIHPSRFIEEYMYKYGLKYENFLARLSPMCIIMGGFISNMVLDTFDKKSDIDIIHYQMNGEMFDMIDTLRVHRGLYNTQLITYDNCCEQLRNLDGTGMFCYPLNLIKEDGSSSDGVKYQHLTLLYKTNSLGQYLDDTCDLDITKIYYDGHRIRMKNIWKFFERRDETDVRISYAKSFRCYNWDLKWTLFEYSNLYSRSLERVKKYQERGINIKILYGADAKQNLLRLINIYGLDFSVDAMGIVDGNYLTHFHPGKDKNKHKVVAVLNYCQLSVDTDKFTQLINILNEYDQNILQKYFLRQNNDNMIPWTGSAI